MKKKITLEQARAALKAIHSIAFNGELPNAPYDAPEVDQVGVMLKELIELRKGAKPVEKWVDVDKLPADPVMMAYSLDGIFKSLRDTLEKTEERLINALKENECLKGLCYQQYIPDMEGLASRTDFVFSKRSRAS